MTRNILLSGVLVLTLFLAACGGPRMVPHSKVVLPGKQADVVSHANRTGERLFPATCQLLGGLYPDNSLQAYLQKVGKRLLAPGEAGRFVVVNESRPDALALPGGFILVTRGLLAELEGEGPLVALLAHQLEHVRQGHAAQLAGPSQGELPPPVSGPSYAPEARLAPERASLLLKSRFTSRQEAEALRGSLFGLAKAGYDPREGLRLQEFFLAQGEAHRAGWREGMLKRHPLSGNDLKALERESGALAGAVKRTGNGEFNQALKRLRANLPGYVLYDEARALERGGQLREAVATYLRAATAAPEESIILAALGTAYLQAGDLGSARLHLAKAVALDQRYYYSRMGLGYAHLQQGGTAAAIAELEASLRLLPSQRAAFLLAEAYEKEGTIPAARQFYRAVAEADSRSKLGKFAAERLRLLEE